MFIMKAGKESKMDSVSMFIWQSLMVTLVLNPSVCSSLRRIKNQTS